MRLCDVFCLRPESGPIYVTNAYSWLVRGTSSPPSVRPARTWPWTNRPRGEKGERKTATCGTACVPPFTSVTKCAPDASSIAGFRLVVGLNCFCQSKGALSVSNGEGKREVFGVMK